MFKKYEKKNEKKKEENIWKRKSGKTFGEENIYFAKIRNRRKEKE